MFAPTLSNQTLIPSLPNDISINILARVPLIYHPYLSLVSKAFHSLLSSSLFFTTRSQINSTETSLFITLDPLEGPLTSQFFNLRNRRLIPLPPIPCSGVGSAYATIGPCIYVLGGCLNGDSVASADVWIFDCRSNKWAAGPRMLVARQHPMVGVVDGKLYVIGGCENEIEIYAEIYDPDVGSWEAVEMFIDRRIPEMHMYGSAVIGRKIYAMGSVGLVAYDVGTRVWEYMIDIEGTPSCCILNRVLYWCDYYRIKGFDLEKGHRKAITGRGIEGDLWYGPGDMQVVNFNGKLVAVWKKRKSDKNSDYELWCMEIDVKKGKDGELQGNICFKYPVSSFPHRSILVSCLAVTF